MSLVPETNFAQGATVTSGIYDTSPAGLGVSPAYLSQGANASATAGGSTTGTTFPASPADGTLFVYQADATAGVKWTFQYRSASASTYKWEFIGGSPLVSEVVNDDSVAGGGAYAALANAGPIIALPLAGDYDVEIAAEGYNTVTGASCEMSYDIGGTGAVDADSALGEEQSTAASNFLDIRRTRRKTGLTAVTLTAKYKGSGVGTVHFRRRYMAVAPVRVLG